MLRQRPHRVSHILGECVDERNAPAITIGFLHWLGAAEITARSAASLLRCRAAAFVIRSEELQVRPDLLVEPIVRSSTPECRGDTVQYGAHYDPFSSRRDIIATVRDHTSVSINSYFLPARVIE